MLSKVGINMLSCCSVLVLDFNGRIRINYISVMRQQFFNCLLIARDGVLDGLIIWKNSFCTHSVRPLPLCVFVSKALLRMVKW